MSIHDPVVLHLGLILAVLLCLVLIIERFRILADLEKGGWTKQLNWNLEAPITIGRLVYAAGEGDRARLHVRSGVLTSLESKLKQGDQITLDFSDLPSTLFGGSITSTVLFVLHRIEMRTKVKVISVMHTEVLDDVMHAMKIESLVEGLNSDRRPIFDGYVVRYQETLI